MSSITGKNRHYTHRLRFKFLIQFSMIAGKICLRNIIDIPLLSLSEIMNLKRINLSAQKIIHTIITILEQIIKTYPNDIIFHHS